jgi:hypothetical protein
LQIVNARLVDAALAVEVVASEDQNPIKWFGILIANYSVFGIQ